MLVQIQDAPVKILLVFLSQKTNSKELRFFIKNEVEASGKRYLMTISYYPEFDFKQELQWGSSWGRTSDWLPLAGEIQKNIFAAAATGDQGTTMGYTIAKHVVDMIEGKKNKFLEFTNPKRF